MVEIEWLGRISYADAWALQRKVVAERTDRELPDRLLLLEHDPVYTLGRSAKQEHLLLDEPARRAAGIALHWVDRGGDITYHGPGQLVGYPILNLKRHYRARGLDRPDLHRYLREIEEVLIQTVAAFSVTGRRYPGHTGVWVEMPAGPGKIAAIGIRVSARGISSHGFALNVDPNLEHFAGIIPCGIREHGVTALAGVLKRPVDVTEAVAPLVAAFEQVFHVQTRFVSPLVSA